MTDDGTSTIATHAKAPSSHHVTGDYTQLTYAEDGPVGRITLNRPSARNALSMRLSDELTHALESVRDSSSLKVLVIRGAGGTTTPTPEPE